jgi:NADPH-dependent curcumin reductase CurA
VPPARGPEPVTAADREVVTETGHPAVDAVLRSLANAARLAPRDQIAEYEAAHQVLQETLASIDG